MARRFYRVPGPSITDIPPPIVSEILLRLSAKTLVKCKCVCKTWLDMISDPHFAKLHSARAEYCILFRGIDNFKSPFYFLEPGNRDSGYCHCFRTGKERCELCIGGGVVVKSKLKIPAWDTQAVLNSVGHSFDEAILTPRKKKRSVTYEFRDDNCYKVLNSSNGFLFVFCGTTASTSDLFCICNPVTGEYTYLPKGYIQGKEFIQFGFGFSPKSNQYKVIMMSTYKSDYAEVAEVHTLGTDSPRTLDVSGSNIPVIQNPSYHDGSLYWISSDIQNNFWLASFNLDDERFHTHSGPVFPGHFSPLLDVVVLDGRLFVYTSFSLDPWINIWLANGLGGVSISWTQLFSISLFDFDFLPRKRKIYRLVGCSLDNQAIVLFDDGRDAFVYYDKSGGVTVKQLEFRGSKSKFEPVIFTPSFVSLKDAVMPGINIEVLNVNSGRRRRMRKLL